MTIQQAFQSGKIELKFIDVWRDSWDWKRDRHTTESLGFGWNLQHGPVETTFDEETYPTLSEAMDAADAWLNDRGWELVEDVLS